VVLYNHRKEHTIQMDRKDIIMKNEIIDTHTDRNGNKWERKIMTNFVGEKYAVLYKNGKKVEVLGRIW
jgi:hypothetical protein